MDQDNDNVSKRFRANSETTSLLRLENMRTASVSIINLDAEVLTLQYSVHFRLSNIPRADDQWLSFIVPSVYSNYPTLSKALCEESYMASPAIDLPTPKPLLEGQDRRHVVPRLDLNTARDLFLAHTLATFIQTYHNSILRFAGEWTHNSYILGEFVFAITSIAAGEAEFISTRTVSGSHLRERVIRARSGNKESMLLKPLKAFGLLCHEKGQRAGAAPAETIYWMKGVVVGIATVVDGDAILEAVDWGKQHGGRCFQIAVISMFDVALAEVVKEKDRQETVRFSKTIPLSPLRREDCLSTHPRTRSERSEQYDESMPEGIKTIRCNSFGTAARLKRHFPGLAALVNFFRVALPRDILPTSGCVFPPEIMWRILRLTDYETQRTCMRASQSFCVAGLRDFRIDEEWAITGKAETVKMEEHAVSVKADEAQSGLLRLQLEDLEKGSVHSATQYTSALNYNWRWGWMPLVGTGNREVLIADVEVQFLQLDEEDCVLDEAADHDSVDGLSEEYDSLF